MRTIPYLPGAGLVALFGLAMPLRAADPVIVHEWGTFTSLQDESGKAIGGINVDDEPAPYFVSSVAIGAAPQYNSRFGWHNLGLPPYRLDKGWVSGDPRVTMRLETPVLYFYPPKGQTPQSVPPLDVHVDFHGGVLSQFYPHADFSGLPLLKFPGNPQMSGKFPYLDPSEGITGKTTTSLDWKGVQLGSTEKPIETDDTVWTTPREVSAPLLQVKFSEPDFNHPGKSNDYVQAEHFLFYRGVGHLDSPIFVQPNHNVAKGWMAMESNLRNWNGSEPIDFAWIVEIRPDGSCAQRSFVAPCAEPEDLDVYMGGFFTEFSKVDFSADNLTKLKVSMQNALVKEGLYPDEASAMLRTWELSYFKSPGLRFFYIVPRTWVDKVLPLKITGAPTKITRVMVGRIELITDGQRAALARLAAGPCPDLAAVKQAALDALQNGKLSKEEAAAFYSGEKPLSALGVAIPPLVRDYLSLGRFRDALIVREQQQHPSAALARFIKQNDLLPGVN